MTISREVMLSLSSTILFIKDNWKSIGIGLIVLAWLGSLFYVDVRRADERNRHWENEIAAAPVKIDTTYRDTLATVKPIRVGIKPDTAKWRAQIDSIKEAAGEDVARLRKELEERTRPFSSLFIDTLIATTDDPRVNVNAPYLLTVDTDVLYRKNAYELTVKPFKLPVREITIEKMILVEVTFWEKAQYYGTGVLVGVAVTVAILWAAERSDGGCLILLTE